MKTDGWNIKVNAYNRKYTEPFRFKRNTGRNNMILTDNIFLSLNTQKTKFNNNVFVINEKDNESNSDFIKSNLLQANCNFVVLDTGGNIIKNIGKSLRGNGYDIKVLDLINLDKSDWYNPFLYIDKDSDVENFVDCIIKNTTSTANINEDPFFIKSEKALLQSLVFYIVQYRPQKEHNISTLINLLCLATKIDNETQESELDRLFEKILKEETRNSSTLKQYLSFRMGARKNIKSVISSVMNRMKCFSEKEILKLTNEDTVQFDKINNSRFAFFIVVPEPKNTHHPLVSIFISQAISILSQPENLYNTNKKSKPIRFFYDDLASIGIIPNFANTIIYSYKTNISHTIIVKNLAQIKLLYRDNWESIVSCCDILLCFGCKEYSSVEYVSKALGKKIIHTTSLYNKNYLREMSKEYIKMKKHNIPYLMSPEEIMNIKEDECILMVRGLRPFKCKKYNYKKHTYYKRTGDCNEKNIYIHKRLEIPY